MVNTYFILALILDYNSDNCLIHFLKVIIHYLVTNLGTVLSSKIDETF